MSALCWNIQKLTKAQETLCEMLAKQLHISKLSARLLVDRGISTAEEARRFIRPDLAALHDPYLMKDMDVAVERLLTAIEQHERIMVYGDYDVDGTTAVALMYSFLQTQTDNLVYYIPDRYKEGYGISIQGVNKAEEEHCRLIIALDCGIKAVDKVEYARSKGIDFIICDHHTPGDEIPKAVAVLNMKRRDCNYPYKELSGCGVGFKLVQAYAKRKNISAEGVVYPLLSLVALSIASDIVPITDENRILAHYGLLQINKQPSLGVQAILETAKIIDGSTLNISDLAFKIGPRINACGRIKSGIEAVKLLITNDINFAQRQAADIEKYNTNRRDLDAKITEEALAMLRKDEHNLDRATTVVYSPDWHKGVVGIAASRLIETFYRPTIVLTKGDNGIISGSARSVAGFDVYTAIASCSDLLTNFGGHLFAAGLSMLPENLPEFKRRFEEYVTAHILPEQKVPTIQIEAEIRLNDITEDVPKVLRCIGPFGPGNPYPIFVTRGLINHRDTRPVGKKGEHLRLDVTDRTLDAYGEHVAISGIAFRQADKALHLQNGKSVDICYTLEDNTFNHITTLQMKAIDIQLNE